jgi:hypothetical protein
VYPPVVTGPLFRSGPHDADTRVRPRTAADPDAGGFKLVELHKRCRDAEVCSLKLMQSAIWLERAVRLSTAGLVGSSLLTGSVSYLNTPALMPLWACITAAATVTGIYSLIVRSGSQQDHWFKMAYGFAGQAAEIQILTDDLCSGMLSASEFRTQWHVQVRAFEALKQKAGPELLMAGMKRHRYFKFRRTADE